MAWRPYDQFIEGILDNTVPGKITGYMRFTGISQKVLFDLEGNFHRDIRGAKVKLTGNCGEIDPEQAAVYMKGFSTLQQGKAGDMTAGMPPYDYTPQGHAYWEWYSHDNGRVVIELSTNQVELLTNPIPACESDPVSRKEQAENMANFLSDLAAGVNIDDRNAIAIGNQTSVQQAKKALANNKIRGMKLLPNDIREKMPALGSQDGKGGQAVVCVKFFTPDSNWTWYAVSGESVINSSGAEVDFQFFGLVDGHEKELGYFNLGELETIRGPFGLPIERDLYWSPKTLSKIAPELFGED